MIGTRRALEVGSDRLWVEATTPALPKNETLSESPPSVFAHPPKFAKRALQNGSLRFSGSAAVYPLAAKAAEYILKQTQMLRCHEFVERLKV